MANDKNYLTQRLEMEEKSCPQSIPQRNRDHGSKAIMEIPMVKLQKAEAIPLTMLRLPVKSMSLPRQLLAQVDFGALPRLSSMGLDSYSVYQFATTKPERRL
jgi:hypothetical protein